MEDIRVGDVVIRKEEPTMARVTKVEMIREIPIVRFDTILRENGTVQSANPETSNWYIKNLRLATNKEVAHYEQQTGQ